MPTVADRDGLNSFPMREYHRPTSFESYRFEAFTGGADPAEVSRTAHDTAGLLLARARGTNDQQLVERLIAYTDTNGIDSLTELWAHESPSSLPGVLWRLYLLRLFIQQRQLAVSHMFQHAMSVDNTIHPVVAGVEHPWGPIEVVTTADEILRGAFQDDFAVALERAAAFCLLVSRGATEDADDVEVIDPHRGTTLTTMAFRLSKFAEDFMHGAALWRKDALH